MQRPIPGECQRRQHLAALAHPHASQPGPNPAAAQHLPTHPHMQHTPTPAPRKGGQHGDPPPQPQQVGGQALVRPSVLAFSSLVWKRPWPNLDAVSMNLSLTSSSAVRDVCVSSERRSVMQRFLLPGTAPCRGCASLQPTALGAAKHIGN